MAVPVPIACGPGLVGTANGMVDRVLYIVADTVRGKSPVRPSPRCELNEAEFWLSFR